MANEKRRLIDADALGIGKAKREAFDNPAYADGWNSAIAIIEQAPTVEAVEVVRCKDCKYASCNPVKLTYGCQHTHGLRGFVHEGFYFCYHGERRE